MPNQSLDLRDNEVIKNELQSQLNRFCEVYNKISSVDVKAIDEMSEAETDTEINRLLEIKRSIQQTVPQRPAFVGELVLTVDEDHSILETINSKAELIFMYREDLIHAKNAFAHLMRSVESKIKIIQDITTSTNNFHTVQLYGMLFRIHNQKAHIANAGEFSYREQAELQRHLPFSTDLVGSSKDIMLNFLLQQQVIENEIRDKNLNERDIIDVNTRPAKKLKKSK